MYLKMNNMKVAIHQPHYFPWEGYLKKIASVDKFILMDEVQLTDSSPMYRHSLLALNGEPKYITIPFTKKEYKHKYYKDITLNSTINWQLNHLNFFKENYGKSPYYHEVINAIMPIFEKNYTHICEVTIDSVKLLVSLFGISTEIVKMSELDYPKESKKNELVLDLCIAVGADYYLSGKGARKYMKLEPFCEKGIEVEFQEFIQEPYFQHSSDKFVPGLTILDMLFSIGIEETKKRFI